MAKYLCLVAETNRKLILSEHNGIWSLPIPFAIKKKVKANIFRSINEIEFELDSTIHVLEEIRQKQQ